MSGAPVPGVVNVHQGITPGGSPQVLSVKALRNTEKKIVKVGKTRKARFEIFKNGNFSFGIVGSTTAGNSAGKKSVNLLPEWLLTA